MKKIIFSLGILLITIINSPVSFANVKDLAKYRLEGATPVIVKFKYQGKEAREIEQDPFDDTGNARSGAEFGCEGGSIVGALNCVTQEMENARTADNSMEAESATHSSQNNSTEDKGPLSSTLEVTLTPKLNEDSKGNYVIKFDVKNKVSFSGDKSDKRILERLKTEASISIPNDLALWSASITQQTLDDFKTNKFDFIAYDLADQFQSAKLYELDSDAIHKMDITGVMRPDLVSVKVMSKQTNPYEITGGERDVTSGYVHNLFGKAKTVRLLVQLKNFDWSEYGRPDFSDPNGEIEYRAISYLIEGDEANQRERDGLFKEWNIEGANDSDLVLVHAYIPAGSLSNFKLLAFEGNHRAWELLYADLAANFQIARELVKEDWRPADFIMAGDRIRIELIFTKPPKIDKIPVWHSQVAVGTSVKLPLNGGKQLILTKTDDAKIYASEPIHVVAAVWPTHRNDKWPETNHVITIPPITEKDFEAIDSQIGNVLLSVDADFRSTNFLGPISPFVKEASTILPVYSSPPDRTLWREALERTAACESGFTMDDSVMIDGLPSRKKGEIKRWSINSIGFLEAQTLGSDVDLLSMIKTIPLNAKDFYDKAERARPTAVVSYGHHAAMLLLRDELLRSIDKQIDKLSRLDQPKKLLQALKQMSYSESNPFNVIAIKLPSGEEVQFEELQWGRKHLEKRTGMTNQRLDDWIAKEMKRVVQGLQIIALDTTRAIGDVDQCDSRELLRVVSDVHGPIVSNLIPKLIKLVHQGYQQYWVADKAAINWVNTVVDLAQEVKYRDKEADIDSIALKFQLAALGIGVKGFWANVTYDVALAAAEIGEASIKFQQSQKTLVVDRGKALILGAGYYRQAEQVARTARFASQQQILMAVLSVPASLAINQIQRNMRIAAGIENGASHSSANKLTSTEIDPELTKPLPSKKSLPPTERMEPPKRVDDTVYEKGWETGEFDPELTKPLPSKKSLPPTERMEPPKRVDDTVYEKGYETAEFDPDPNKTLPPPNKTLAQTERMEASGATSVDYGDPKWSKEMDELLDDLDDVLPKQSGRVEDIFDKSAGARVNGVKDKEGYLQQLTEKSARGETLNESELLDKLDLMRLKREAKGGNINNLPEPDTSVTKSLPSTERVESSLKFNDSDKTIKVGSDADPSKTVKVDPSTQDPADMATRIESGADRVKQPVAVPEETRPGLPEGQVDVFENDAGARLAERGITNEDISALIEKSRSGKALTTNEMLTMVDYLRTTRARTGRAPN